MIKVSQEGEKTDDDDGDGDQCYLLIIVNWVQFKNPITAFDIDKLH